MTTTKRTRTLAALLALALVALVPVGAAHEAPPPPEYKTRLLHDCIDDYYGGDASGGKSGHDVHALDLHEAYDAELGEAVLTFRLLMHGGHAGSERPVLKDVVSFDAKGTARTGEFTTQNNQDFQGTFDRVRYIPPSVVQDGERFVLEGTFKRASLGLADGDTISNFRVDSHVGDDRRDFMPGTYVNSLGGTEPQTTGCSGGGSYTRPDYTIGQEGPATYLEVNTQPTTISLPLNSRQLINLNFDNELRQNHQDVTLTVDVEDGISGEFHDPETDTYRAPFEFGLTKNARGHLVHLALTGEDAGASGTATVTAVTNLGGRITTSVDYTVQSGGPTTTSPAGATPTDAATTTQDGGGAPATGILAAFAAGLVALAWHRRRP